MTLGTIAAISAAGMLDPLNLGLLGRLLLATLLGGLVGLERELSGKPAGLRTNILICVGATLLMEISIVAAGLAPGGQGDPSRIAAQVVSGIGFIGAGTILFARGHVVGLTTAATLWVVAAIGLAIGARAYREAIGTTVLVFVILVALRRIEDYVESRRTTGSYEVILAPDPEALKRIESLFAAHGLTASPAHAEKKTDEYRVTYNVAGAASRQRDAFLHLTSDPSVRGVHVA